MLVRVNSKSDYFDLLGREKVVQELGVEEPIKELTEDMLRYVATANRAQLLWKNRKKRNVRDKGDKLQNLVEDSEESETIAQLVQALRKVSEAVARRHEFREIEPHFMDIATMTYNIGTNRPRLTIRGKGNPLEKLVSGYRKVYDHFNEVLGLDGTPIEVAERQLEIPLTYFDPDTLVDFLAALSVGVDINKRVEALDNLYEKSMDILSRHFTLMELARSDSFIDWHYGDEAERQIAGLSKGDLSSLTARWGDEKFKNGQVAKISGYFSEGARCLEYAFKTLFITATAVNGNVSGINPADKTEAEYAKCLQIYKDQGFAHATFEMGKRDIS
jgi:cell fate (sporulation/competence/biofilm development) regulator YlbF (YheA/YmcA/DUF963 family)